MAMFLLPASNQAILFLNNHNRIKRNLSFISLLKGKETKMKIVTEIESIKDQIIKGNISLALNSLLVFLDTTELGSNHQSIYHSVILLNVKNVLFEKLSTDGLLNEDQKDIKFSKIVVSALQLLAKIEELILEEEKINFSEFQDFLEHQNQYIEIELTIDRNFEEYSEREQSNLIKAISKLLNIEKSKLSILKKKPGSVKLSISLPISKAGKLFDLILSGNLEDQKVFSAKILGIKPLKKPRVILSSFDKRFFLSFTQDEKLEAFKIALANEILMTGVSISLLIHIPGSSSNKDIKSAGMEKLSNIAKLLENNGKSFGRIDSFGDYIYILIISSSIKMETIENWRYNSSRAFNALEYLNNLENPKKFETLLPKIYKSMINKSAAKQLKVLKDWGKLDVLDQIEIMNQMMNPNKLKRGTFPDESFNHNFPKLPKKKK